MDDCSTIETASACVATPISAARAIMREVCAKHRLRPRDVLEQARFKHFVAARREIIVRLIDELGWGLCQTARFMERDHTSIRNSYRRAKGLGKKGVTMTRPAMQRLGEQRPSP